MSTPLLPGMPTPPKEAWREHTAERWKRDDPEGYAACLNDIFDGQTSPSALAKKYKRSRTTIYGLIRAEIPVEQFNELIHLRGLIVSAEALDRQEALLEHAGARELGALAQVSKSGLETAKLAKGQPTAIAANLHVHVDATAATANLMRMAAEMGLSSREKSALPRTPDEAADRPTHAAPLLDAQSVALPLQNLDSQEPQAAGDTSGDTEARGGGGSTRRTAGER